MKPQMTREEIKKKQIEILTSIETEKRRQLQTLLQYADTSIFRFRKRAALKRTVSITKRYISMDRDEVFTLDIALRDIEVDDFVPNEKTIESRLSALEQQIENINAGLMG